jgi:type IV pilus assembly protein PilA
VSRQGVSETGFTLLEILIALAIVSILAMVAVPYYQDYRTRAKVAADFGLIEPVKKRLIEEFMLSGSWPVDNDSALVDAPENYHGQYLQSVEVSDQPQPGSLKLTYDNTKLPALGTNNTIIFYPQQGGSGSVSWKCDKGSMVDGFRPQQCR